MSRQFKTNGTDSTALHSVIQAMMDATGRGGLTSLGNSIGMTPSATKKRMSKPSKAWDEPTMRAVLLVTSSKADDLSEEFKDACPIVSTEEINGYEIEVRDVEGTPTPFWRTAP